MAVAKRFWEQVTVVESDDHYAIFLDKRKLMTPAKNPLVVPTTALAEMIAEEWRAVEGEVNPNLMPMTKRANSAIERVGAQRAEIETHLAAYIDSDLLCYRASAPAELVTLQTAWDVWINWAAGMNIVLDTTTGVMPIAQPEANQKIALEWMSKRSEFELAAIYDFIAITGSFVLAQAVAEGELTAEKAFELSRIDANYQESVWGIDEDDAASVAFKLAELVDSYAFFKSLA